MLELDLLQALVLPLAFDRRGLLELHPGEGRLLDLLGLGDDLLPRGGLFLQLEHFLRLCRLWFFCSHALFLLFLFDLDLLGRFDRFRFFLFLDLIKTFVYYFMATMFLLSFDWKLECFFMI